MILSYDVSKMRTLLKNFYLLTGIKIVIFSDTFYKIAEYPDSDCDFCSLIRSNASAEKECISCDRMGCEKSKKSNSIYSYVCHAGLTETVAPVRYGNIVIGYIMFGQVLQADNIDEYWKTVKAQCQAYQVDMDKLREYYFSKKPVQMEQVYAAAQIMEACAGYLYLERYISLQEDSLPKRIDEYISENLTEDLSVSKLCRNFGISRTMLYKISNKYYGKGIEQALRQLRIERAKELLKNSGISVSEVSADVGINDYNYFIKVFKKEVGLTPKQYQNSFKF